MGWRRDQQGWASELLIQQTRIPVGQMMLESQKAARSGQQQLANDVQAIDLYNRDIDSSNRYVRQALVEAIGSDQGEERTAWEKWLTDLFGYAYSESSDSRYETEKPTVVEQVPLDYQPQAVPVLTTAPQVVGFSRLASAFLLRRRRPPSRQWTARDPSKTSAPVTRFSPRTPGPAS